MNENDQALLKEQIEQAKFAELDIENIDGKQVFVATDETVDREGEVISIDGWDLANFKRNPILLWSHNPFEPMIGRATNIRMRTVAGKKKMTFEPEFHKKSELSSLIADLVENGWMKTVSVGFRPYQKEGNKFTKQEMLEISFVNIPANPEATQLAFSKGYGTDAMTKLFGEEAVKRVISYKETPMAPRSNEWDGAAEVADASIEDMKAISAWYDADNADVKSSYKLPHHKAGADHKVVFRGVVAAMGALLGARGGPNIPDSDRRGVYNHLAKHYAQFGEEPPAFREYTGEELKGLFPELYPLTSADLQPLLKLVSDLEVAIKAKPETLPASVLGKGRKGNGVVSRKDRLRRVLQVADKAIEYVLRETKE